jgi:Fe-S cluster assembly protein SufB
MAAQAYNSMEWPEALSIKLEHVLARDGMACTSCVECPDIISCCQGLNDTMITQIDNQMVYQSITKTLVDSGVVFCPLSQALQCHESLVQKYMATLVPYNDNPSAALNTALWSSGIFLYVPAGVHLKEPLQAFFGMMNLDGNQFERTLLIIEDGSAVTYHEGCGASPVIGNSMHNAVAEIFVGCQAQLHYAAFQKVAPEAIVLATKRVHVEKEGMLWWHDHAVGGLLTVKEPRIILAGMRASVIMKSCSSVNDSNDYKQVGCYIDHRAPYTHSSVESRVCMSAGLCVQKTTVIMNAESNDAYAQVVCDGLFIDTPHTTMVYESYPVLETRAGGIIEHESTTDSIHAITIKYLQARGFMRAAAYNLIITHFVAPVVVTVPASQSIELLQAMVERHHE